MKHELEALYNGEKSVDEVYHQLVPTIDTRSLKRARYAKMRIKLPEESLGLNLFLRLLFALPFPLFIARFALRKGLYRKIQNQSHNAFNFELEDINHLIKYSKGTTISIDTDDAQIRIKIR